MVKINRVRRMLVLQRMAMKGLMTVLVCALVSSCALVGVSLKPSDNRPIEAGMVYEFGRRMGYGKPAPSLAAFSAPDLPGWTISKIHLEKFDRLFLIPKLEGLSVGDGSILNIYSFRGIPKAEHVWQVRNISKWHQQRIAEGRERGGFGGFYRGGQLTEFFGFECSRLDSAERALTQVRELMHDYYRVAIKCPIFVGGDFGYLYASFRYILNTQNLPEGIDTLPIMQRAIDKIADEFRQSVYSNTRFLYPMTQTVPAKYADIDTSAYVPGQAGTEPLVPGKRYVFGAQHNSEKFTDAFALTLPQTPEGKGWRYNVSETKRNNRLQVIPPEATLGNGLRVSLNLSRKKPELRSDKPSSLASFLDIDTWYEQQLAYAKKWRRAGHHADVILQDWFKSVDSLRCLQVTHPNITKYENAWRFAVRFACPVLLGEVPTLLQMSARYWFEFETEPTSSEAIQDISEKVYETMGRSLRYLLDNVELLYPMTQEPPQITAESCPDCPAQSR